MGHSLPGRSRRSALALALAASVTVLTGSAWAATPSPAAARAHHPLPVLAGSSYLALGDSVPFGYREPANLPTPDYADAAGFVGYPELVASALGLRVANAACPGETSASLVSATALSFACRLTPAGLTGYRTQHPLHVSYGGTQLRFALHYLRHHPHTRLITLMIGANDGFLCQATTGDHCVSEFPSLLSAVAGHVTTILTALREKAHYRGQIVIVNYYSLDYRSALQNGTTQALNRAVDAAAKPFHASVARASRVFRLAAVQAGGDTCAAGLLTRLTTGGCGVHPSVAGQALLAQAVEQAIRR